MTAPLPHERRGCIDAEERDEVFAVIGSPKQPKALATIKEFGFGNERLAASPGLFRVASASGMTSVIR